MIVIALGNGKGEGVLRMTNIVGLQARHEICIPLGLHELTIRTVDGRLEAVAVIGWISTCLTRSAPTFSLTLYLQEANAARSNHVEHMAAVAKSAC